MSLVVLLIPGDAGDLSLGGPALQALAQLGISRLAMLRDGGTVAVLVEGWAFDPSNSPQAIELLMGSGNRGVRTLHPVGHMWVP